MSSLLSIERWHLNASTQLFSLELCYLDDEQVQAAIRTVFKYEFFLGHGGAGFVTLTHDGGPKNLDVPEKPDDNPEDPNPNWQLEIIDRSGRFIWTEVKEPASDAILAGELIEAVLDRCRFVRLRCLVNTAFCHD